MRRWSMRALRSLRVVQSQRVSSMSSSSRWSGVADEPAHRGVGPAAVALAVAVEPQVQLDEPGHVVDHVVGLAQLGEALAGHAGADHLVVVELHPLGPVAAGAGLADVVEEGGEPGEVVGRAVGLVRARRCRPRRWCG